MSALLTVIQMEHSLALVWNSGTGSLLESHLAREKEPVIRLVLGKQLGGNRDK